MAARSSFPPTSKAGRYDVGTSYDLVCELANDAHAHEALSQVLHGFAKNVRCEGLEKLMVVRVSELPGPVAEALIADGISPSAKVPYSATYYYSAEPVL